MADDQLRIVPPRLFKYLPQIRVDVIENLRIRFTPLMATNDIFEVRRTFRKLVGPKFDQVLSEQSVDLDPEETAVIEIRKLGISDKQARLLARKTLIQRFGPDYKTVLQKMVADLAKAVVPALNRDENIEQVLMNVGGQLVGLSLSEDAHNSMMWAHYGEEGRGFVLEFDTSDGFFSQSPTTGKTRRLQKVEYFDDSIEELMDAPEKALISKTTNWMYEKEWRLTLRPDEADAEFPGSPDPIHLFNIPPHCITKILLGYSTDAKFIEEVKALASAKLENVKVKKLVANRFAGTFSEEVV
jgi:Protein of unknown function (DUF2971)